MLLRDVGSSGCHYFQHLLTETVSDLQSCYAVTDSQHYSNGLSTFNTMDGSK